MFLSGVYPSFSLEDNPLTLEDVIHDGLGITELVSMTEGMFGKFTMIFYVTYLVYACIGFFFASTLGNSFFDGFK